MSAQIAPLYGMNADDLRREMARRLREMREARFRGMKPEAIARVAKERHFQIAARTIRDYEDPETCNPTLDKLDTLLAFYGSTLGDFFAFTAGQGESVLIGAVLEIVRDPELKKALKVVLSRIRPQLSGNNTDSPQ